MCVTCIKFSLSAGEKKRNKWTFGRQVKRCAHSSICLASLCLLPSPYSLLPSLNWAYTSAVCAASRAGEGVARGGGHWHITIWCLFFLDSSGTCDLGANFRVRAGEETYFNWHWKRLFFMWHIIFPSSDSRRSWWATPPYLPPASFPLLSCNKHCTPWGVPCSIHASVGCTAGWVAQLPDSSATLATASSSSLIGIWTFLCSLWSLARTEREREREREVGTWL